MKVGCWMLDCRWLGGYHDQNRTQKIIYYINDYTIHSLITYFFLSCSFLLRMQLTHGSEVKTIETEIDM